MSGIDNMAIGLMIIALLVFVIVFVVLLYYAYSGQSSNNDDCDDYDINVDPGANEKEFMTNLMSKDIDIPGMKIKPKKNSFNFFRMEASKNRTPARGTNKNVDKLAKNIRDGMNTFDKIVREPFIAKSRATKVEKIDESDDDDSSKNKVAARLKASSTIPESTCSGKLFIFDSRKSIEVELPKTEGMMLKFWNSTDISHSLKSKVPIFNEKTSCNILIVEPGQFVVLESLGNIWLITTKTESGVQVKPTRPCKTIPDEECDFSDTLDLHVTSLLDGQWTN